VQMTAFRIDDQVALVFITVLDELTRGLEDDDEEVQEPADRGYWESRAGKEALGMADHLLQVLQQWDPKLELKYNKGSIGLAKDGVPARFVTFKPKRQFLRVETRVPQSNETDNALEEAGLDVMPYKWGKYRIRLTKADLTKHEDLLVALLKRAYESRES